VKTYLTPRELLEGPLAGLALADFYAGIKPGGALHRLGFPDPVPFAAGRKKKWDRAAVADWQARIAAATVAHVSVAPPARPGRANGTMPPVDRPTATILHWPGEDPRSLEYFQRLALARAAAE
jgi:predicted DNA-binding transcriptional regulator AlpA